MKANYTYWQWQVPKCLKRQPEQRSQIKSVSKGIEASATDSTHILKLNKLKQMKLVNYSLLGDSDMLESSLLYTFSTMKIVALALASTSAATVDC